MNKVTKEDMRLYVVTDRSWLRGRSFLGQLEEIACSGATFLQLREKDLPFEEFVKEAKAVKELAARYRIPFVINDSVEVCLASGADGVHVGQKDMEARDVRRLLGADKIIGVTAKTVEQAVAAEQAGADYLGVGAVFGSTTKLDAVPISLEQFRAIRKAVSIPIVAIGGIQEDNLLKLSGSGADGVAVISAVFAREQVGEAAKQLRILSDRMVAGHD